MTGHDDVVQALMSHSGIHVRELADETAGQRHQRYQSQREGVRMLGLVPPAYRSLILDSTPRTPAQRWLIARTRQLPAPSTALIPHAEATLLTLLAASCRACRIVEVGRFTGYTTLALAMGACPGGRLVSWEEAPNDEWVLIAREAWEMAGISDRIDFRNGRPANTGCRGLRSSLPERGLTAEVEQQLDLAVIDAERVNHRSYWDLLVPRMRSGGIVVVRLTHSPHVGKGQEIARNVLLHMRSDSRMQPVDLPYAKGLAIARRSDYVETL